MDRELIRNCCRHAKDVYGLFKSLGMEEFYEHFTPLNITDLSFLSQMNESDLRRLGLKTGPRKKIIEVVRILKDELPNIRAAAGANDPSESLSLNDKDSAYENSYEKGQQFGHCCNDYRLISQDQFIIEKSQSELERCQKELNEKRLLVMRTAKQTKQENGIVEAAIDVRELLANLQKKCQQKNASLNFKQYINEMLALFTMATRTPEVPSLTKLNISEAQPDEKVTNKENIHCIDTKARHNKSKVDTVKDSSKRENQIGYLAQINYGGAPRGMYGHFYDGIRMAGQNSPHSVFSPQFVTRFPPVNHPVCFSTVPQQDESGHRSQYNSSPLMYYPSSLMNFDVRFTTANVVTTNSVNAFGGKIFNDYNRPISQFAMQAARNGTTRGTGQARTSFNNFSPPQDQSAYCYKQFGNIDTGNQYGNGAKSTFTSTQMRGPTTYVPRPTKIISSWRFSAKLKEVCKKKPERELKVPESQVNFLAIRGNIYQWHQLTKRKFVCGKEARKHMESGIRPQLLNFVEKGDHSQNLSAGFRGNQYFKAESGKLLPRRL